MSKLLRVIVSAGAGTILFFFVRWCAAHVVEPECMTFVTICILVCAMIAAVGINETILAANEEDEG